MRDAVGYPLSGCNAQALDLFERANHEFRCFAGNPLASAEAALAAAPELVMAHVLRAWLLLLSTEAPAVPAGPVVDRDAVGPTSQSTRLQRRNLVNRAPRSLRRSA
jgi:hypothetical protein